MNTSTELYIFSLPHLYTPSNRELELMIDSWAYSRARALAHVQAAWDMYDDAIERQMPHDEIEQLAIVAETMEGVAQDAYEKLNAAKAALLGRMN